MGESGNGRAGESGSGGAGEWESLGAGKTGRAEEKLSLRGIAEPCEAIPLGCLREERSDVRIPNGIASTIIPANDNDHAPILGSVFLEAIPSGIVTSLRSSRRH